MNTDKTLADVQPSGRVRLGDQAERARFEAWIAGRGLDITRWSDGSYTDVSVALQWFAWQEYALSAQPSPGGQGGALAAMDRLLAHVESLGASQIHPDYVQDARTARAALAARQPVGEPVAYTDGNEFACAAEYATMRGLGHDGNGWRPLYAAPPAQAVDLGLQLDRYDAGLLGDGGGGDVNWWQDYIRAELDRAHEFYQDQADSQAAGK